MQSRGLAGALLALAVTAPSGLGVPVGTPPSPTCSVVVIEGEVRAGEGFRTAALARVEVRLEPVAAGWVLRVVPMAHAGEDWAEMATPPYRSVTPLLVSTDFSLRAQDAVGWNPRRFRFAANNVAYGQMRVLRQAMEVGAVDKAAPLAELVSRQPGGVLEILDAHLIPGTGDQARAAAMVAGHFAATAHELEQPAGGRSTPLGQVTWMRFRVLLEVPRGTGAAAGRKVERGKACGGG